MNVHHFTIKIALTVAVLWGGLGPAVSPGLGQAWAAERTECFKCHTSAKKLIELTRSLYAGRPPQANLSEGPG